ncbi:glycoside hydrolase family 20 protein [Sclerotinia borealis F-4128]|uniref:Beta-hexosaminidase n=1 Tax=Sclerotinia borealis (strain F-4128) TaxID=1432307 RepID=W9CHW5_SCLBF|nr:glycoside hydrolase family 20 protein [Sclerotinia borealis F-4128]
MLSSTFLISALVSSVLAIWPQPVSYTNGTGVLWLDKNVKVTYDGGVVRLIPQIFYDDMNTKKVLALQSTGYSGGGTGNITSSKTLVSNAVTRAMTKIFYQGLTPWKFYARNTLPQVEPSATSNKIYITELCITQTGHDNSSTFKPLDGQVDESYNLTISTDGKAAISALSSIGILHALTTFTQLFYTHSIAGTGVYTKLAPVTIYDAPKFAHRGLNMDVSRNWYPVEDIKRMIVALAYTKCTILHLHITDAQSWPLDIPAFPELSKLGAYQTGLSYTPHDLKDIQAFGVNYGVEVILEIDMPGHTSSIGYSHPELLAAFNAEPWDTYCAEPPCGSLRLNDSVVPVFLEKLFDDLLPRVSPYSSYFHTGGDEVNVNTYLLDPTVQSNDTAVLKPLIQAFVDRNHKQLRAAGLTPVVWEEMITTWNLTLGTDVVVQSWLSDASVAQIVAAGHKALAGNYNFWYLDCGKGQWLNFEPGTSSEKFFPYNDYCSPTKSWRLVYSYDPLAGVPENATHLVIGGEFHIWSEQTDPVNIDDMVWPRGAAAAEILWSGAKDPVTGQNRSQIDAGSRLPEFNEHMRQMGIRSGPVQMIFCTQLNSTECSL